MKVMLICTTGYIVRQFRLELINALREKGNDVIVVADYSDSKEYEFDFDIIDVKLNNRSSGMFDTVKYYRDIKRVVKKECPDIVCTFMIKPNTVGAIAARRAGVKNVFSMIEGMGTVYTDNSLKYRLIRIVTDLMYKISMKKLRGLFCLNDYDAKYFIQKKYIRKERVKVIPGIGLDTSIYKYTPISNYNRFVLMARLYKEKGVEEYCKAAEIVKEKYPDTQFLVYGYKDPSMEEIVNSYERKGVIEYMGITNNTPEVLSDVGVVVLPSYREGASRIIMEAMAAGRPVITYDTVGCNHLVRDQVDGYLVELKSVKPLAEAMIKLVENRDLVGEMGKNAHDRAVKNFDSKIISDMVVKEITCNGNINQKHSGVNCEQ